jgi:hypothetical protein
MNPTNPNLAWDTVGEISAVALTTRSNSQLGNRLFSTSNSCHSSEIMHTQT